MKEQRAPKINGFIGLFLLLVLAAVSYYLFRMAPTWTDVAAVIVDLVLVSLLTGLVVVQPNQAKAVVFFGGYRGTLLDSGFWLTVPFSSRRLVSLRVRNFNSDKLKVNDKDGNPVEIAAVVVFKVINTAGALFEVDDYQNFVEVQSESAIRHVAGQYPYDTYGKPGYSLRENTSDIADELQRELQERLNVSGVEVIEARLTHLAYASEIAGAMLQRQQAAAVVAAREMIVEGAVGMVKMAIKTLEDDGVVELDEERKATMVNNLMVSITSDKATQPVINTGSLY
ncbi:SPFH domain-containing protein [Alicyclobacillus sp. SO9]|uniref:SPFH domain-containing protein n=1 Tax=Alicyclobacillus sp. SO9 TaxID=2665646 RepID=UPI0018E8133B|nr:SPFH domain-containing protein [Alicyclobacillus sp. SO9]QQE81509.1 SPFH domain-containing protein [Alicyclobacillus sp. SO9]